MIDYAAALIAAKHALGQAEAAARAERWLEFSAALGAVRHHAAEARAYGEEAINGKAHLRQLQARHASNVANEQRGVVALQISDAGASAADHAPVLVYAEPTRSAAADAGSGVVVMHVYPFDKI